MTLRLQGSVGEEEASLRNHQLMCASLQPDILQTGESERVMKPLGDTSSTTLGIANHLCHQFLPQNRYHFFLCKCCD